MCYASSSDGMSMSIAIELNPYYWNNKKTLKKVQYSDCAYFVKEKDQNKNFEEQISFYKEMFSSDYEEIRYSKEEYKRK